MENLQNKYTLLPNAALRINNSARSQLNEFVTPSPVSIQEAVDFKTCDFDVLVANVSKKILVRTFKKVYAFVISKNSELEFRDIPRAMEEILVRTVKDKYVLLSQNMNNVCKRYCNHIINELSLASNRQSFMLVCVYKQEPQKSLLQGLGVECSNILVYKKLYNTTNNASHVMQGLTSMSSLSSTPPISRSTSMDSMDSRRSNLLTPRANEIITHGLKLLLNFIKDTNQTTLEFTGLSSDDGQYLHSLFSCVIAHDVSGVGDTNVYRVLRQATNMYALEFKFCVRNVKSKDDMM